MSELRPVRLAGVPGLCILVLVLAQLTAVGVAQSSVRGWSAHVFDTAWSDARNFVEVLAGWCHTVARRADGSVVAWGSNRFHQCDVPALPTGLTYVDVAAGNYSTVARLGPTSSFVTFGDGCAGSLPATHLVPLDTPRIGATLQVFLDNLPWSAALLLTGFDNRMSPLGPLPFDLGLLGMPGCMARVSPDCAQLVFGVGRWADCSLRVPQAMALVGVTFFQQALVPDPTAGNAAGVVVSDATEAVVGR